MRKKNGFLPTLEVLENRISPALTGVWGMPSLPSPPAATLAAPGFQVTNQAVPRLEILPGVQHQLLAQMTLSATGRMQGRLDEMLLIPAFESLAQSVSKFALYADLNGKAKDGCEAFISSASADWQTDVVDFHVFRPVWVRSGRPVKIQVFADVSLSPFGESVGVALGQAVFKNVRNEVISDTKVRYRGVQPVQHTMENRVFQISQRPMDPFGVTFAGQTDINLIQFSAWSNVDVVGFTTFTASQESLDNAENYRLVHTDWFGVQDAVIQGTAVGDQLTFSSLIPSFQGGTWTVTADIKSAENLTGPAVLQLAFVPGEPGIAALDLEKAEFMQGFVNNGIGAGQVQFWGQQHYATQYTILLNRPLASLGASLSASSPMSQTVTGNQTVVAARYKITATYDSYAVTGMKFSVSSTAASVIMYATLSYESTLVGIAFPDANGWFNFTGLNLALAANTVKELTIRVSLGSTATTVNAKVTMTYMAATDSQGVVSTQHLNIDGRDLFVNPPTYG